MAKRWIALGFIVVLVVLGERDAGAQSKSDFDEVSQLHRTFKSAPGQSDRDIAQYGVAALLYRIKFRAASFAIFSEIADRPQHARYRETLPWLAKLATDLPEPADVIERVGKYDEHAIDRLEAENPSLQGQLSYLLARYKYRNRQYDDAIRLFAKVDRGSRYFSKAQFRSGIASVQLRKPADAVQSFQEVVRAIDDDGDNLDDPQSLRDLALLSIARSYYSSALRLGSDGLPIADSTRLATAVKYWNAIDATSEYWIDAQFEESWAYFMMGDHARALGNLHTIRAPYFAGSYYPEVDILRATLYLASCQYEDVTSIAARYHERYQPIATELAQVLHAYENTDDAFYDFLRDTRDGRSKVSPIVRPVVEQALSDRQLLRHLQYVAILDDEKKRLARTPPTFRGSSLETDIQDVLDLSRDITVRNAAVLARERYTRTLTELEGHLRTNTRLLAAASAGQTGTLNEASIPSRVAARDAERNVVRPDDEHVIWPFTGEYWSDEVGSYRQSIRSKCR